MGPSVSDGEGVPRGVCEDPSRVVDLGQTGRRVFVSEGEGVG